MPSAEALLERAAGESLRLLRENLLPEGILAAARGVQARRRRYDCVFARDAGVCVLAMARSGNPVLERGAVESLATLARAQADNGQIPKFVDLGASRDEGAGDFWYVGCIDATLWWLIALDTLIERGIGRDLARRLRRARRRAIDWLRCQEHPQLRLLQQNEASDWADIMPRAGFVLYTNALWYHLKQRLGLAGTERTRAHFNQLFDPSDRDLPASRRLRLLAHFARRGVRQRELYLSYVNLGTWGEEGDVFGNVLAVLFGLADGGRARRVLRAIARAQAGAAYPVRTVCSPITPSDPRWRLYMGRHRQNLEHQYHNGGIWPMVGGFWVAALAAAGQRAHAARELLGVARANAARDWEFNEWFHGRTGAPCGMPRQSWNAAAFLLARDALRGRVF